MTLWDGHGRTPHDGLEQFQGAVAMIFCCPCLCFLSIAGALSNIFNWGTKKQKGETKDEGDVEAGNGTRVSLEEKK